MSGRNSAYSPLPQSNSDSESSSEELHAAQESRIINRVLKSQKISPENSFSDQKSKTINYKLLDADGDIGAALIRFQPTADEVSILKPNNKVEIFSTSRKLCFVFSLLLCVFTTVVFLWFLPCNSEGTCFSALPKTVILSWEQTLDDLELYGPIGLFSDASRNKQNLIFLIRNPLGSDLNTSEKKTGLIMLNGENGMKWWNISLSEEPTDIDCCMIDVNSDGVMDCLIFGRGVLKAIDSTSGSEFWSLHDSNKDESTSFLLDFPLTIYDLDGDNVNELLTSCSLATVDEEKNYGTSSQNHLVIISGKTGLIINTPLKIKMCSGIHNFMFENNSTISYTCYNSTGKESLQTISFDALSKTVNKIPVKNLNLIKPEVLRQHRINSNSISIDGHRLLVENSGNCPENCNVLVEIKDEKSTDDNNAVYTYSHKNTYCMLPAIKKSDGETDIVLKFWEWQSKEIINNEYNKNYNLKTITFKNSKKSSSGGVGSGNWKNFHILDSEMLSESDSGSKRFKRAAADDKYKSQMGKNVKENGGSGSGGGSELYMHVISETVIGVTFTKSHPTVRNITQENVVQLCKKNQICEPDVKGQEQSLLVADLNGDGKEELISFSTKYTHEINDNNNNNNNNKSNSSEKSWKLESVVKVFTLSEDGKKMTERKNGI